MQNVVNRRRGEEAKAEEEEDEEQPAEMETNTQSVVQPPPHPNRVFIIGLPRPSNQVHNMPPVPPPRTNNTKTSFMIIRHPAKASIAPRPPIYHMPPAIPNWPIQPPPFTTERSVQIGELENVDSNC